MLRREWAVLAGVGALGLSASSVARAAPPKVGEKAPGEAKVEDVDERVLKVSQLAGKPALVVYEDKDSKALNDQMKKDLEKAVAAEPELAAVRIVAVADVSEYDFWPARGAVKDAIRDEQKKTKTTIWLDWSGSFRDKLGLVKATSNFLLLDAKSKVTANKSGKLSADDRKAILEAMRKLVRDAS